MAKLLDFKELREQLSDEMVKSILGQFNVEPYAETAEYIIFPTCCHNLIGGSPKLYYYKDSKIFHCYTECSSNFDIFTLLMKMQELRGNHITLRQAVQMCDLDTSNISQKDEENFVAYMKDLKYMQTLNNTIIVDVDDNDFKKYDKQILYKFPFDYVGLMPWIQEGIGIEALQKFNIRYDKKKDAIVIPNFDYSGDLIGIRERFFSEEELKKGKYRPMYYNNVLYNHPTGRTFYGIYENHKAIERKHTVVIFEGEKSVLLYATIYGCENNIALATLGQNITQDHIQYLLKMRVQNVILAYDTDYEDYAQLKNVESKYIAKAELLSPYFNVSILMDYDFILPYKSSPIDSGKETFEKILNERRII